MTSSEDVYDCRVLCKFNSRNCCCMSVMFAEVERISCRMLTDCVCCLIIVYVNVIVKVVIVVVK